MANTCVVEAVVDDDGCVRVVKGKTAAAVASHVKRKRREGVNTCSIVLTRPITSLRPLEMDE